EDGLTILFTTHHPHHALAVSDQALLMIDASKYLCGPARDVLTGDNLESLYGLPLKRLEYEYNGSRYATLVPVFLQRDHANG
ncbi:MAG: ABC transporter ATP-binding protein, partial [Deltaproteobacteria bacterium]|nr:ABC transporter ATP-binding protein [Deltaproteobacteria bacterium]